jgi:hypothetical protein
VDLPIQRFAGQAGWSSPSLLLMLQGAFNTSQVRSGQRVFDEREELAFFKADVVGKDPAEVVKACELRRVVTVEGVHPLADCDVVAQHACDERVMSVAMAGEGGKQHLLLQAKVRAARRHPEAQRVAAYLGRRLGGCAAQAQRNRQRLVMVAR